MMTRSEAAAVLGRLGGSAGTEAQNEARRENGKKGGRPPKKKAAKGRKRQNAVRQEKSS